MTLDFSRPGKPTDNGFIESLNGSLRAKCLRASWFLFLLSLDKFPENRSGRTVYSRFDSTGHENYSLRYPCIGYSIVPTWFQATSIEPTPQTLSREDERILTANRTETLSRSKVVFGDCAEVLDEIDSGSAQLVVSSPPYNIGKEYESNGRMTLDEYLSWLNPILDKILEKISDTGSICWQVGSYVSKGEVFPLDYYFYPMFARRNFRLRNRIVWRYNFGLHANKRLSGRYQTVLWFSKSDTYKFNLDPIRIPQLYPGKRHSRKKGGLAGTPSGNPLGKNPSDYWEFSGQECFVDDPIWNIPNVKFNHPEKTPHPCQFPIELAERCVLAFSDEGDVVLDPFMGVGTTIIAAMMHHRSAVGIEKDGRYFELAKQRIDDWDNGQLLVRKSGQAPRRPKPTEKVAAVPDEWK